MCTLPTREAPMGQGICILIKIKFIIKKDKKKSLPQNIYIAA
jgi:hypothetical protein